jgi:hypothetical protein
MVKWIASEYNEKIYLCFKTLLKAGTVPYFWAL